MNEEEKSIGFIFAERGKMKN